MDEGTGMPSHRRSDAHGFTLTEVLIVIIVGGILSAIAIPAFMTWAPKYRANGAARELFSELMAAKAKAISEGNNYIVSFDTGNNAYTIHDDDDGDGVQDMGESVRTVSIPASYEGIAYGYIDANNPSGDPISGVVTFTGSPPRVTFMPSGLANKLGAVYLKPADETTRKDRQRCITVLRTGRVRLYKHSGTSWE
jgi:prepilin-type N-terminal cleavage/methylation domain-containing protein